jgi:addiction module RelE/StbE family toxin
MKIVFTTSVKIELSEIVKFISKDKPQAARDWVNSIHETVSHLSGFPKMGRVVPEYSNDNIREIIKGNYRIVYKIDKENDTIAIITVHHGKRQSLR